MDAEDVSLSSFKTKEELHDRFWINEKLNSRVREKLLDIADDFIDELAIPNFKPKDIVFTGSLANYNWSRYSDIDVHIVVSFKDIYKKVDLIDDYFKSKKEIWNQTHEKLKIYGYPVEISVENADEPGVSSGVYSLIKNKWVTEPSNFDDAKLNEKYIKEFSAEIMNEIDEIEKRIEKETSNSRLEELGERTMKIFKRLKNMRKEGLARSGEMSRGNIIYKLLRRMNYLDKIWDIVNNTYNKINSIK
jgi:predicted nucleotidyltransferase